MNLIKCSALVMTAFAVSFAVQAEGKILDISAVSNMGFADDVPDDGKGGWTDQGPLNDMRSLKPGRVEWKGIAFEVLDPAKNSGRSCIVLKGAQRDYFPEAVTLGANGVRAKYLYLLNAVAWSNNREVGEVIIKTSSGAVSKKTIRAARDTGDFWTGDSDNDPFIAWRGENPSTKTGLYATKVELPDAPLESISLKTTGIPVWMIVAATLSDSSVDVKLEKPAPLAEGEKYISISPPRVTEKGGITDLSQFLDAPAGKYGFAVSGGNGHIVFEKRPEVPARFWGVNLCFSANYPTRRQAEWMVDHIASAGYNLIRFHHFDNQLTHKTETSSTELEPDMMRKLDYLAATAKKKGLYITIDLFISRKLRKGEIPSLPDAELSMGEFKALSFINRDVMENFEKYSRNLLEHVNEYTGVAWKDEPAIVSISLVNENTISALSRMKGIVKREYDSAFAKYITEKNIRVDDSNRASVRAKWIDGVCRENYARYKKFLRDMGVKAMLTDQNFIDNIFTLNLRRQYDIDDTHFYWGHPSFLDRPWTLPARVSNASGAENHAAGMAGIFGARIFGMPFSITEWDYVNPNEHSAEGAFLVGAYGALQDHSMLVHFTYSHSDRDIAGSYQRMGFFNVACDPVRLLADRAGAMMFLHEYVAASKRSIPFLVDKDFHDMPLYPEQLPNSLRRIGLVSRTGVIFDRKDMPSGTAALVYSEQSEVPDVKIPVVISDPVSGALDSLVEKGVFTKEMYDAEKNIFRSDTGELISDAVKKCFIVKAPKCESFTGSGASGTMSGAFADVKMLDGFATVFIASRDGKPLEESGRLMILFLTNCRNDGAEFRNAAETVFESYGSFKILMRKARAELTLKKLMPDMKAYACDFNGRRLREVDIRPGTPFILDNSEASVYEIVKDAK